MVKTKDSGVKKSHLLTAFVAGIVAVLIVIIFLLHGSTNSPYSSTTYPITPQVYTLSLLAQGQVFSINPGSSYGINFTVPTGSYNINVTGSYTSQGKVEVAILTPAQYGAFTQNRDVISSSQYYYGDTQGSTINSQLSVGSYTLVFYDPGVLTQDTVTVIDPIQSQYTT